MIDWICIHLEKIVITAFMEMNFRLNKAIGLLTYFKFFFAQNIR